MFHKLAQSYGVVWLASALASAAVASCRRDATISDEVFLPRNVLVVAEDPNDEALIQTAALVQHHANATGGFADGHAVKIEVVSQELPSEQIFARAPLAIIGAASNDAAVTLSAEASDREIAWIETRVPTLDFVQPAGDSFVFRVIPNDAYEMGALAIVVADIYICEEAFLISGESSRYRQMATEFENALRLKGVAVGATMEIAIEPVSLEKEAQTIAMLEPRCAVVLAPPSAAGLLLEAWQDYVDDRDVNWIVSAENRSSDFVDLAGGPQALDFVATVGPAPKTDTDEMESFARIYGAFGFEEPSATLAYIYDALLLSVLAPSYARLRNVDINNAFYAISNKNQGGAESFGPAELDVAIATIAQGEEVDYAGASGAVDFDAEGNVASDFDVFVYDATAADFLMLEHISGEYLVP